MNGKNYKYVTSYDMEYVSHMDISKIKRDINYLIINSDLYHNYLSYDISNIQNEYEKNINNCYYFESVQKILYSYINNKYYNVTYDYVKSIINFKLFGNLSIDKFLTISLKSDVDYYKDRLYPENLKLFFRNLKSDGNVIGHDSYNMIEDPIIIKNFQKYQEILNYGKNFYHELITGLYVFNKFKKDIPNIPYIFAYLECTKPIFDDNLNVISWCEVSNNENDGGYVIKENIQGPTLKDYINECSEEDLTSLVYQYLNFLNYTRIHLKKYINKGTNLDNLIVKKIKDYIYIPIYTEMFTNKYLKTNIILYISDFSDSYIEYTYTSTAAFFYDNTVKMNNLKENNTPDYTFEKFKEDVINLRNGFKLNPNILTFVDTFEKKESIKFVEKFNFNFYCKDLYKNDKEYDTIVVKFNEFLDMELNKYDIDITILDNYESISIISNFNKLLIFLKGCLCFNFIEKTKRIFKIYDNFQYILKNRFGLELSLNLSEGLEKSIRKIPKFSLFGITIRNDYETIKSDICYKIVGIFFLILSLSMSHIFSRSFIMPFDEGFTPYIRYSLITYLGSSLVGISLFNGNISIGLVKISKILKYFLEVFLLLYFSKTSFFVFYSILIYHVSIYLFNPKSIVWNLIDGFINLIKLNGLLEILNNAVSISKNNIYNLIWNYTKYDAKNEYTKEDIQRFEKELNFELPKEAEKLKIFLYNEDANTKLGNILNEKTDINDKETKINNLINETAK